MDFSGALSEVQNGPRRNLYLLSGEEEYFIDILVQNLLTRFLQPGMKDFNYQVLFGPEISDQQLMNSISEFPMMSEYRVILCYDFDKVKIKNQDIFNQFFSKSIDTTILILVVNKLDKRKTIYKNLLSIAFNYEAKKLYEDRIPGWILNKVKSDGYLISSEAAEALFSFLGSNLRDIANELEKIYLYLDESNKEINFSTIEKVSGFSREYSPFQLANFIIKKDIKTALSVGTLLLEKGEPLVKILSGIYFQFNKLWQVAFMLRNNKSEKDVLVKLNIRSYFFKDEKKLALMIKNEQYGSIMEILADTDRWSKSTGISEKALFGKMLFEIHNCLS